MEQSNEKDSKAPVPAPVPPADKKPEQPKERVIYTGKFPIKVKPKKG